MLRGFLSGILWGGVVVVVVVSVASLLAPLPATVSPQTTAVEGIEGSETAPNQGTDAGALTETSSTDATVEDPLQTDVAEPEAGEIPPLTDTESAPRPEVGASDSALNTPDNPDAGGAVHVESENPVLPNPQAENPSTPAPEDEPSISNNPPQPQAPEVTEEGAFPTPAPTETVDGGAGEAVDNEEEVADLTPSAEDGAPDAEASDESLLTPAGDLDESFEQRTSERLPTVGEDTSETEESAAPAPRPFVANAEPLDNPAGQPVMSIVLVDVGDETVNTETLQSFPYPLSVAVSTLDAQAAEKATKYREMGFEVLALIDLPAAAAAADVEVAMEAHLSVMSEAVAVMEGFDDGLQGSREVSDQVTDVLASEGYGMLMLPNGLNTAQKLAAKEGVPSATVFRDFDSKGQSAVVMRRFLDQAAFKAAQTDGVVMVGRIREDTIAALLLWGLQDRASTVALAPVSAALNTID
ncbi:divergent polysaccharide deacetylase family protein [Shimia abyssi]|uniref:Polysaccharide deacetylase 2 family uncharacterized protein YibQ n=1 Tax=Shimia abyssi TaxID=1662395 RepID=A0A2P8FG38_9RHOB|nr:divergent polysaccharide deacetylase family protein [Shimia abyssi]PSL20668.1 polysaccharide deacetylase 2 family uncharacterized protein YibQ [Shimia abyssi]